MYREGDDELNEERCCYPMQSDATGENVDVCATQVGYCTEGLCDYHCKHVCDCGGFALVEPKEKTV